jgi:hypothetical protein
MPENIFQEKFTEDVLEVLERLLLARIGWADAIVTPFAAAARRANQAYRRAA